MFMGVYTCTCWVRGIWKLEVGVGCLPRLLSTLLFKIFLSLLFVCVHVSVREGGCRIQKRVLDPLELELLLL